MEEKNVYVLVFTDFELYWFWDDCLILEQWFKNGSVWSQMWITRHCKLYPFAINTDK